MGVPDGRAPVRREHRRRDDRRGPLASDRGAERAAPRRSARAGRDHAARARPRSRPAVSDRARHVRGAGSLPDGPGRPAHQQERRPVDGVDLRDRAGDVEEGDQPGRRDRSDARSAVRAQRDPAGATGERTGERTGSSGGQAKAQPRALWSTSFGSHPSGSRRSASGAPTEAAVAPLVIGRARRRPPRRPRRPGGRGGAPAVERPGTGPRPRRADRREASDRARRRAGAGGRRRRRGGRAARRAFVHRRAGGARDARHRDAGDSQPAARRARVRRRHAERPAHADGPDRPAGRAAACRSGSTSRATNPSPSR